MRRLRALAGGMVWIALLGAGSAHALEVPPHTGLVVDQAHLLRPELRSELDASLREYQRLQGPQLQLLTIPSLEGDAIESYSIRVVDQWKLGKAGRDDGVLLLVVSEDRQMRIEVGKGLEGQLPDVLAGRIVNQVIVPYFKDRHYEAGVVAGLQAVANRLGGTLSVGPQSTSLHSSGRGRAAEGGGFGLGLIPILFLLIMILRIFSHRRHGRGGFLRGLLLGGVLNSRRRGGWGDGPGWGGGGGGGGFGGFGGGGGGGFSGGGASGRW